MFTFNVNNTLVEYLSILAHGIVLLLQESFLRLGNERNLFGTKELREAQRCMLRSDMLHTYYKHREEDKIRQYEKENFLLEYKAYKRLKGNSFIDDIEKEIRSWDVIT